MKFLYGNLRDKITQTPDAIAFIQGDTQTTYREFGKSVERFRGVLSALGVKQGDHVAIVMDNSAIYASAYYAIWAVGGVVVALNTVLKSADFIKLTVHSESKHLLHDGKNRELKKAAAELEQYGVELLNLVELNQEEVELDVPAEAFHKEDQLASIIYTSGTTGHPKGVMLSHQNLAANISSIVHYLELTNKDRLLCVLPFFYSYGNSVLHTHLYVGASLILENSFMYPAKVLASLQQNKATGFSGVPSTFALLMARTKLEDYDLSTLHYVTQAGGAMPPADIERFKSYIGGAKFYVMYGQTEASARLTYMPPSRLESKMGSVGIAIPNVELKILDEQGNELGANQQGEICACGKNVMQGYWKDPEETTCAFHGNWLRTGDTGYIDNDGFTYIVGRNKEMIKTGAHRIAPKEIEELIAEIDGVIECAVVGMDDEIMGQVIKAVVVLQEDCNLQARDILKHCHQNLATYKLPKTIKFTDALPKTASGKIQKHLLS